MPSFTSLRSAAPIALVASVALVVSLGSTPAGAISSLGSIPVGDGPVAIELRPDGQVAFVANSASATVSAINLATQVVTPIEVGFSPLDLQMRPGTNELWVTNYASGTISIVNALTFVETTFINVGNIPQNIVFSPSGARAYVTMPVIDSVLVINTATRSTIATWAVGDSPDGIALDTERNRLIVASEGSDTTGERVNFVNLSTGAVTSLSLFDDANEVYVDAARDRAYVSMFGVGTVAKIDLTNDSLIGYLGLGGQPTGMAPSFDRRILFVATGGSVKQIDLEIGLERGIYTTPSFTNDVVMSRDGRTVYSTSYSADAVSVAKLGIDRFAGANRYATAIAISKEAYPGTASSVYIASGTSFADALSIAPGIGVRNGPLLLNPQDSLRADVLAEVNRLNPATIFIAGGTGVISNRVKTQLEATGADVVRLAGTNRYATSQRIVQEFFDDPAGYDDLYLVTGANFPDALSAGAAAAASTMPMLLVDGGASRLPNDTIDFIESLQPERVILVGGTSVMSSGIRTQVNNLGGIEVVRASGADRYETSVAVTELGFDYRNSPGTYWATGANFPDALAGITIAAAEGAPIYLVRPTCLPSDALHGAWRHGADRIGILGGTGVVSNAVRNLTLC